MFHPADLEIIKNITHSISETDVERLKTLRPGVALCFGNAFNIPTFTKIDKPDPTPNSSNAHIGTEWFRKSEELLEEQERLKLSQIQNNNTNIVTNENPIQQ